MSICVKHFIPSPCVLDKTLLRLLTSCWHATHVAKQLCTFQCFGNSAWVMSMYVQVVLGKPSDVCYAGLAHQ